MTDPLINVSPLAIAAVVWFSVMGWCALSLVFGRRAMRIHREQPEWDLFGKRWKR